MDQEKKNVLTAAGLKVDETLGRFMNSDRMYMKFLNKFLDDKTMGQLEEACAARDYHQIFVAAHTLKGVAGNLGIDSIAEIVVPMSEAYRSDPDESYPLDENMAKLRERYQAVCDAIRQINE